ncbi:MAG: Mov34/MPN/PAD-1 family protein [Iamia sp.]
MTDDAEVRLTGADPDPTGPPARDLPTVAISASVVRAISDHVSADTAVEYGGVLVGRFDEGRAALRVNAAIPARRATSQTSSLTFTHEAWEDINDTLDRDHPDLSIVGWYHSHPSFGIFLSEYDRFIQSNFFSQPWQIAYVEDPVLGERGLFGWQGGDITRYVEWAVIEEDARGAPVGNRPPITDAAPPHRPGLARLQVGALALILGIVLGLVVGWGRGGSAGVAGTPSLVLDDVPVTAVPGTQARWHGTATGLGLAPDQLPDGATVRRLGDDLEVTWDVPVDVAPGPVSLPLAAGTCPGEVATCPAAELTNRFEVPLRMEVVAVGPRPPDALAPPSPARIANEGVEGEALVRVDDFDRDRIGVAAGEARVSILGSDEATGLLQVRDDPASPTSTSGQPADPPPDLEGFLTAIGGRLVTAEVVEQAPADPVLDSLSNIDGTAVSGVAVVDTTPASSCRPDGCPPQAERLSSVGLIEATREAEAEGAKVLVLPSLGCIDPAGPLAQVLDALEPVIVAPKPPVDCTEGTVPAWEVAIGRPGTILVARGQSPAPEVEGVDAVGAAVADPDQARDLVLALARLAQQDPGAGPDDVVRCLRDDAVVDAGPDYLQALAACRPTDG